MRAPSPVAQGSQGHQPGGDPETEPVLRPHLCRADGAIARRYELKAKNVLAGNGSDEVLAFAFRAFCGAGQPVAFADVTYGFYKSQAALFDLDVKIIPLREDFTLHVDDYMDFPGTIVIANPNAPTRVLPCPGTTSSGCWRRTQTGW